MWHHDDMWVMFGKKSRSLTDFLLIFTKVRFNQANCFLKPVFKIWSDL